MSPKKHKKTQKKRQGPREPQQATPPPPPAPNKTLNLWAAIGLIVCLGFAVYANSFSGKFVWDDEVLVQDNDYISAVSPENIKAIFAGKVREKEVEQRRNYRPLLFLTFMADHAVWKFNVLGYHLTSTLIHVLAAVALFFLLELLSADRLLAFAASLLFVAHPVHTEAVTYISGRADPLAGLFVFLSFYFYLRSLPKNKNRYLGLALTAYVLALLSRENALTFAAVPLLYHFVFEKKWPPRKYLSILAVTGLYLLFRFAFTEPMKAPGTPIAFLQRVPGMFVAFTNYLKLLILPFNLHMEYLNPRFRYSDPRAIAGAALAVLSLFLFLRTRKNHPLLSFSLGWYLLFLLPQSGILPINAYMAEHWLYLPSAGIFLILAGAATRFFRRKDCQAIAAGAFLVLTGFFSVLTIRQNATWRDPVTFYQRILSFSPRSARVMTNLAMHYLNHGRAPDAADLCERAVQVDPRNEKPFNTLSMAYNKLGRYEDSIEVGKRLLSFSPEYLKIHSQMAIAYVRLGKLDEAVASCRAVIAAQPGHAKIHDILGVALMSQGKNNDALAAFQRAIELLPNYPEAYYNMGILLQKMEKLPQAAAAFDTAIRLRPTYDLPHLQLGALFLQEKRFADAVTVYEQALKLRPRDGRLYANLAAAYYYLGEQNKARELYARAQELGVSAPKLEQLLFQQPPP